jgi:hypothetical protein
MPLTTGGCGPPSPTQLVTMTNPLYHIVRLEPGFDLSSLLADPDWAPHSLEGYRRHQKVLVSFIEYCFEKGWTVDLPIFDEDTGWDHGIDVFVNGEAVDLKSFPLREDAKSKTLDSPAYNGKGPHPKSLTEWLVFAPPGTSAEAWEVAPFKKMRKSYKGFPPFFWKNDVMSFLEFASTI